MAERRTYPIKPIVVNHVKVVQVVVDPHYEKKHVDHIYDQLILKLVKKLDGRFEVPETRSRAYSYFATLLEYDGKWFRVVWLLEAHAIYIGVVNAFRNRKKR